MRKKATKTTVIFLLYGLLAAGLQATPLGIASAFNVFTLGDANLQNTDINGRVAIGGRSLGDIVINSFPFANVYPHSHLLVVNQPGTAGFTVNAHGLSGGYYFGSQPQSHLNLNGQNGAVQVGGISPIDWDFTRDYYGSYSGYLGGFASTGGSVTAYSGNPGLFSLNANQTGLNVFSIDASTFLRLGNINNLVNGSEQTVLVNILDSGSLLFNGSTLAVNGNQVTGDSTGANRVIFNFVNASQITLQQALGGSILAPNANLTNYGTLHGNIIAKSLQGLGEIHGAPFTGDLPDLPPPSEIPEPGALLLTGIGLAGIAWRLRSRLPD